MSHSFVAGPDSSEIKRYAIDSRVDASKKNGDFVLNEPKSPKLPKLSKED